MNVKIEVADWKEGGSDRPRVTLSDGREAEVSECVGDRDRECDLCGQTACVDEWDDDGRPFSYGRVIYAGDGVAVCSDCVRLCQESKYPTP